MYFTNESEASEDDSYLGYSTAAGDFDGDGQSDVAVGMPRGANLTGKVRFTNDLFIYLLLFEKKKKKKIKNRSLKFDFQASVWAIKLIELFKNLWSLRELQALAHYH